MGCRGAAAAVVVFDITNAESFAKAKNWVKELQRQGNPNMIMALAGNKADLAAQRSVTADEAKVGCSLALQSALCWSGMCKRARAFLPDPMQSGPASARNFCRRHFRHPAAFGSASAGTVCMRSGCGELHQLAFACAGLCRREQPLLLGDERQDKRERGRGVQRHCGAPSARSGSCCAAAAHWRHHSHRARPRAEEKVLLLQHSLRGQGSSQQLFTPALPALCAYTIGVPWCDHERHD